MRLLVFLILPVLCICLTFSSQAEPVDDKDKKSKDKQAVNNIVIDSDSNDKSKDANKPETSEVERFVMPFTKWVEGKLHSSPIVNPTKEQIVQKNSNNRVRPQVGLRAAIKLALNIYPGTVLSADKSVKGEVLRYKIKIISANGVVKIVTVPSNISSGN